MSSYALPNLPGIEAELDRLSAIHFERQQNELAGRGKVSDVEQQRRQQAERVANIHKLDAQFELAGDQSIQILISEQL